MFWCGGEPALENSMIVQAQGLKKYYPVRKGLLEGAAEYTRAVDGVSFSLCRGESLGVIGESGCGKSTLSRMVVGLETPTDGRLELFGEAAGEKMSPARRERVQMVFQDPYASLDPRMKVRRIVAEPLRIHTDMNGQEQRERVRALLDDVGLDENAADRYPHEFSGGQRQRIGIARALATRPDLLVCDEPVSALDVSVQAQILNLFGALRQKHGLAYLFVSHDMGVIRFVSDRILVMYLGRVVELADKTELFDHTLHPYTQALMDSIPVPDPAQNKRRVPLSGDLPDPRRIPEGCVFAGRCPQAWKRCREQRPELVEVAAGHHVACHLHTEGSSR